MIILSKLALQRRSVTIMALILVLVGGIYSYQQLQQELFPEISLSPNPPKGWGEVGQTRNDR